MMRQELIRRYLHSVKVKLVAAVAVSLTLAGCTYTPLGSPASSPVQIDSNQQPYVVLYKNVVAGDYSILRLSHDGQVEFIQWNRLNQILSYRRGSVSSEEADRVFQLINGDGFRRLAPEYDLYPLPEDDTRVYEDIYYLVQVNGKTLSKTVIAHEQVLPEVMETVVAALSDLPSRVQTVSVRGNYIIAGEYTFLRYKRFIIGEPDFRLQLDPASFAKYSFLEQAVDLQYSLHPVNATDQAALGQLLNEKQNAVELDLNGQQLDVLLLHNGTP